MIQAPNTAYMPQYMGMPQAQMPQQMYQPQAQQQAPSYYYNYPTASCYQPQPQYNGVKIDIINPQGMSTPTGYGPIQPAVVPAQPWAMPVQTPAPAEDPQKKTPDGPVNPQMQQPAAGPVVPPPVVQPAQQPTDAPAATQTQPNPQQPTVEPATQQLPGQSPQEFAAALSSDDTQTQLATMEKLANIVKNDAESEAAHNLQNSAIYESLLGIIAKDTTQMQGPTEQQIALRQQLMEGKTLSPEQEAEAKTPSPMEAAETNKQFALYSIAYLQNALVDELSKKNGEVLNISEIPAIEQVVETAKSDPNPYLREAALNSLSHIARPEYKPVLSQIFELAKNDADQSVREKAQVVSEKLATL